MLLRAFRTRFAAGLVLTICAAGGAVGGVVGMDATPVSAAALTSSGSIPSGVLAAATPDAPPITANPFLPDDRGLGECISAVPKPGCGSEERGGWHQQLVLLALVLGLSIIGWRIVAGIRKQQPVPATDLTPSARD